MLRIILSVLMLSLFLPTCGFAKKCIGDCVNGFGKLEQSGNVFEGQWKNSQPNGKGVWTRSNGNVISGDNWVDGKLQGQGTETYPDGRKYVGEFNNTKYNGYGVDTYPDGRTYSGNFIDGIPSGSGKLSNADGSVYEGEFVRGIPQGKGTYTYPDGSKYVGELKNGGPHGYGEFFGADGEKLFAGQWKNGEEVRK